MATLSAIKHICINAHRRRYANAVARITDQPPARATRR